MPHKRTTTKLKLKLKLKPKSAASKKYIVNPLTGRKIQVGGTVYNRLIKQTGGAPTKEQFAPPQKGPPAVQIPKAQAQTPESLPQVSTSVLKQQSESFFDRLVKKTTDNTAKPIPTRLAPAGEEETPIIPKNKFALMGSSLPPGPSQTHSYYHHHAPFAQDFGSYVCLKKETLQDLALFFRDTMFTSVDHK